MDGLWLVYWPGKRENVRLCDQPECKGGAEPGRDAGRDSHAFNAARRCRVPLLRPHGIRLSAVTINNSFVNGHKGAGCGRDWKIGLLNDGNNTDSRRIAQGDFPLPARSSALTVIGLILTRQ